MRALPHAHFCHPMVVSTGRLRGPDGHELAYDQIAPRAAFKGPGVVFLHGLGSDRKGNKVLALIEHCLRKGYGFLAIEMYGHGESTGRFEDGGPGRWRDDAVLALDKLTQGPQVIVGSSMGGWIMLLAALARPERTAGLIGIAAAPDFTEDLLWDELSDAQRATMMSVGFVERPSDDGGPPMRLSRHLVEDGRKNLILGGPLAIACPVSLLHGQRDDSVPWQRALDIAARVTSEDVRVHIVKDGEHRLSRPQDLALLMAEVDRLVSGA